MRATPAIALAVGTLLSAAPSTAQESWTEVRTPHFTVVTNAAAKDARKVADQFERFRAVLVRLTNGAISKGERPVEVLAVRDERSMRAMAPEYWESEKRARPDGLFVRGVDRLHVLLRLDVGRDYAEAARGAGVVVNPYHIVFHEYVHALLQQHDRLPLWLNEGLAEFFANSLIEENRVLIGKPSADAIYYLRESTLMPVERLLQVTKDSPEYRDADRTARFYAQSWALLHYLRLGDKGANAASLTTYWTAVESGTDSIAAAKVALGDLRQFQQRLFTYIGHFGFYQQELRGKIEVDTTTWTTRVLPPGEAAVARARLHTQ